ncbi:MAG: baseplate J/gp47 family protein [Candidatus Thorarchaeota archaeon]
MEVEEKIRIRANSLKDNNLNGFDFLRVNVLNETRTELEVYFLNQKHLNVILNEGKKNPSKLFPIKGGERIIAGPKEDQLKVINITDGDSNNPLKLTIQPTGDYSVYTLRFNEIDKKNPLFDPLFSEIQFKMRPGCFNSICFQQPEREATIEEPNINYLAKDYESFKHLMISAMAERVPGWTPTSEADLDIVLIELICAVADELSDFQDRIMNEAYFAYAKNRISIARHARLMDYHIYQGNQSSTWLAFIVQDQGSFCLPKNFEVHVKRDLINQKRIIFSTKKSYPLDDLSNRFTLYTWSDTQSILRAGSTTADLKILVPDSNSSDNTTFVESNEEKDYSDVACLYEDPKKKKKPCIIIIRKTHILIQESMFSGVGEKLERVIRKRQILKVNNAIYGQDPLTGDWYVRIFWDKEDCLTDDYNFSPANKGMTQALFHGNLAKVYHGEYKSIKFYDPESKKTKNNELTYERTKWGTICRLPHYPISYEDIYFDETPNGKYPPKSTLQVCVQKDEDDAGELWEERINFIHSDENAKHFIVETDENYQSLLRFGNGINGKDIPAYSIVCCTYQVGIGSEGNIGADILTGILRDPESEHIGIIDKIKQCWNPLEITNGRDQEDVAEIHRKVPEAYKFEQFRGITVNDQVDDYEKIAQEIEQVQRAHARYKWMGSWRIVELSIDPLGIIKTPEEFEVLKNEVSIRINAVKIIGDKVVVKKAENVPLEIHVTVVIHPDYWIDDVKILLEAEFTENYTPDGRLGFFHPDLWTFGQTLKKSQIIGRIQSFEGVSHVIDTPNNPLIIKRWILTGRDAEPSELTIHAHEIIQVKNDPMQLEKGYIYYYYKGGRQ